MARSEGAEGPAQHLADAIARRAWIDAALAYPNQHIEWNRSGAERCHARISRNRHQTYLFWSSEWGYSDRFVTLGAMPSCGLLGFAFREEIIGRGVRDRPIGWSLHHRARRPIMPGPRGM